MDGILPTCMYLYPIKTCWYNSLPVIWTLKQLWFILNSTLLRFPTQSGCSPFCYDPFAAHSILSLPCTTNPIREWGTWALHAHIPGFDLIWSALAQAPGGRQLTQVIAGCEWPMESSWGLCEKKRCILENAGPAVLLMVPVRDLPFSPSWWRRLAPNIWCLLLLCRRNMQTNRNTRLSKRWGAESEYDLHSFPPITVAPGASGGLRLLNRGRPELHLFPLILREHIQ